MDFWLLAFDSCFCDQASLEETDAKRAKLQSAALFQLADTAVTSRFFWSYCKMLYCLHGRLQRISTWCEACSCHEWESEGCPLRGRRCHELADGSFQSFIQECNLKADQDFLACQAGLAPDQVAILQTEFQSCTDLMLTEAKIKTAHWDTLPWALCALASDSESRARLAAHLFFKFDNSGCEALSGCEARFSVVVCNLLLLLSIMCHE